MTERTASCSCGQLTATVAGDPIGVSVCHCLACQRLTGSAFAAQARFAKESVKIEGKATQYVRMGDEGSKIAFSFCPVCGSTVHYAIDGMEDAVLIPIGAFAEPDFPAPTFSVYQERKHSWVTLPENIEHMA